MSQKGFLFDLDGTLIDTVADLARSANLVLEKAGHPTHPAAAYKIFVGNGIEALMRSIFPKETLPEKDVKTQAQNMSDIYKNEWAVESKPYAGVFELLDFLNEAPDWTPIVYSNKPDVFTKKMVKHFFPNHAFATVQGACELFAPKPSPEGALFVAHQVGIKPKDFLYLGDTDTDMKTATSSGMLALGAAWGFRTEKELKEHGAQHIFASPLEIIPFLKSQTL